MNRKIYLVRHGEIEVEKEKKYIGITDYELSGEGIEQAKKLEEYFSRKVIENVYSSPLKRCIKTTELIIGNKIKDYIVKEEFKEINLGDWEGKTFVDIKENFPKLYEERGQEIEKFIPPNGESFKQLADRTFKAYQEILNTKSGSILIVAHAGVNKALLCRILNKPLSEVLHIQQHYGCINELTYNNNELLEYKIDKNDY